MQEKAEYKNPALAVDVIIPKDGGLVFIRRGYDPYKGYWSLPGGFVEYGERVEHAAVREAKEETGLDIEIKKLIGVFSDPDRDPRKHVVSVCFLARPVGGSIQPSDESPEVKVLKRINRSRLPFDHPEMLEKAGFGSIMGDSLNPY